MDLHTLESKAPLLSITLLTLITIIAGYLYLKKLKTLQLEAKQLPPGSFGLPIAGESISFIRALKQDSINQWMRKRIENYGPMFKTSLFGSKLVVVSGQVANRLAFSGADPGISFQQPQTSINIIGKYNLFEFSGSKHKLIRAAIVGVLKPDNIQRFVTELDSLIQDLLLKELGDGKNCVKIVNLMKKIAFNVSCNVFLGLPDGKDRDEMFEDFRILIKGGWAIPLNFPGTTFYAAMKARGRLCKRLTQHIKIKKTEIEQGKLDRHGNIISALIELRDENGEPLAHEVILDLLIGLTFASNDTTAVLMTLFIRHLSKDSQVYTKVLQEHNEILKNKRGSGDGKLMSWTEIQKMKYTWRVAQELLRLHPPLFGNYRLATTDICFDGFYIPKGWQVMWVASGTHMEKEIFEDPEKFDPSRFENSRKNYPPYTYLPFGAGPRVCPGAEFARIESMLVIHHFITKYNWKLVIPDEPITCQPLPYPAMGLPLQISTHHS